MLSPLAKLSLGLVALVAAVTAGTAPAAAEDAGAGEVTRDVVAGGRHIRIATDQGAVHVWRPRRYAPDSAGIVVYVHGYFTGVDQAWSEHDLAEQFAQSRQNALFMVPEAPSAKADEVRFKDLRVLLATVGRMARIRIPDGPLVVVGHSGAYRTIAEWLSFKRIDQIILIDALYAHESDFRAWIDTGRRHAAKKLVIVSIETIERSDAFVRDRPLATRSDRIPVRLFELSRGKRNAQLIYLKSQFDHMALVTARKTIPLLLRLTPLQRI